MSKINNLKSSYSLSYLSLFLLFFGLIVRVRQYFYNRSLWFDESLLALNLVNRSYKGLLDVLDYNQAAPPLFLWLEKLAIQTLGNNEYALRLFPFVCGIISLYLFYLLATRFTSGITTVIAIALFISLKEIVYYTTELKQYSSDLAIGLLLFLILISLRSQILNLKQIIGLSILGSLSIWLSHPSIFIMAGVEMTNLVKNPWHKIKSVFVNRIFVYIVWLTSFAWLYVLTIQRTMGNESLVDSWSVRYPDSIFDIVWLLDAFGRFFHKPLGFIGITDGIAMVAFLLGAVTLYRKNSFKLFILNAPLLVTLIAAYLHKYPFRDRLILFLSPYAILIVAEGIAFLIKKCYRQYRKAQGKNKYSVSLVLNLAFTSLIVISLTILPLSRSSLMVINPSQFNIEKIGLGIEYIKSYQEAKDIIYVFPTSKLQFKYYADKYNLASENHIYALHKPSENEVGYRQEIAQIKNKERVWFILSLSRVREEEFPQQKEILLNYLDKIANQIYMVQGQDFLICLYDFDQDSNTRSPDTL